MHPQAGVLLRHHGMTDCYSGDGHWGKMFWHGWCCSGRGARLSQLASLLCEGTLGQKKVLITSMKASEPWNLIRPCSLRLHPLAAEGRQ